MQVTAYQNYTIATILDGDQNSDPINFKDFAQGGFILPAAFTSATVSFLVCNTFDGTYAPLYDSSNALISITVTQGQAYSFPIGAFAFAFVKLRSASAEGADREISVGLKY